MHAIFSNIYLPSYLYCFLRLTLVSLHKIMVMLNRQLTDKFCNELLATHDWIQMSRAVATIHKCICVRKNQSSSPVAEYSYYAEFIRKSCYMRISA